MRAQDREEPKLNASCMPGPPSARSLLSEARGRRHDRPRFTEEGTEARGGASGLTAGRGTGLHLPPSPPLCLPEATSYLAHTATEVSANVGGRGQPHGGLHAAEVEEGVQVEALALAGRGAQHRASAVHAQAAILVEALRGRSVPVAQGQWLRGPQHGQPWGGQQAGMACAEPPHPAPTYRGWVEPERDRGALLQVAHGEKVNEQETWVALTS